MTADSAEGKAPGRAIWRILLVGAALRVAWTLLCPNEPSSDPFIYDTSARQIASGNGFAYANGNPIGFWPPGYSFLLAAAYRVAGPSQAAGFFVNVALGLVTILLTYETALRLFGGKAARWSALAVAAYPSFVLYTTVLASENAFVPLTLLVTLAGIEVARRHAWLPIAGAGAALGVAILVRATALALPAVTLVTELIHGPRWRRALLRTLAIVVVAIGICTPWGLRNLRVFGEFNLSSFNGGAALWMGNHEGASGTAVGVPPEFARHPLAVRDRLMRNAALAFVREHPGEALRLAGKRMAVTLRAETIAVVWNRSGIERRFGAWAVLPAKGIATAGYYALALAFLLGAVRVGRRRALARADLVPLTLMATMALPFVLIVGQDRYHFPLVAPAAMLAAAWWSRGSELSETRRGREPPG
jgi:4-amino-4-deoxy-L-arabinose transferase-like glycosyltransferase